MQTWRSILPAHPDLRLPDASLLPSTPTGIPMTETIRLAKRVADMLSCSRREAELYIEGGWVRVDGEVVDLPQFRVGQQKIEIAPGAQPEAPEPVTLLLHKPAGQDAAAIATAQLFPLEARSEKDHSRIEPHRRHFNQQQFAAPLPATACGLLVVSQDWRILKRLRDGSADIEQEWLVRISGQRDEETLTRLQQPLFLDGRPLPAVHVSWQNERTLRFALKDCRPGQIEYLCRDAGLQLQEMKRIRLGRLPLAGMPPGQWRYLGPNEKF